MLILLWPSTILASEADPILTDLGDGLLRLLAEHDITASHVSISAEYLHINYNTHQYYVGDHYGMTNTFVQEPTISGLQFTAHLTEIEHTSTDEPGQVAHHNEAFGGRIYATSSPMTDSKALVIFFDYGKLLDGDLVKQIRVLIDTAITKEPNHRLEVTVDPQGGSTEPQP